MKKIVFVIITNVDMVIKNSFFMKGNKYMLFSLQYNIYLIVLCDEYYNANLISSAVTVLRPACFANLLA